VTDSPPVSDVLPFCAGLYGLCACKPAQNGAKLFTYPTVEPILRDVTQSLTEEPAVQHAPTPPAVWTRGLVRKFNKTVAVDQVDLNIQAGEFYGLLGQNGAGKTTTIKCIVGLLRPTEGTAGIGEHDTWESPLEVKARIGVLPEEFNLYERLTGAELLDFTAAMHGLDKNEALKRRNELLDMLDLTGAGSKLIGDYSRGMRKKIALGAAIIHRPPVLFLDEPFEGVDAVSARLIRNLLQQAASGGTTVVFSSHEMHLVEKLCTRIGIMVDGRLTIEETPEGLCRLTGKPNVEDAFIAAVGGDDVGQLSWYETS
jgi:ABC-2 type transport system ATP-binding protein